MELITVRSMIRDKILGGSILPELDGRLRVLDPETASSDDVAAILGSRAGDNWPQSQCSECDTWCDAVVEFPDADTGPGTDPTALCLSCIREALKMLEDSSVHG